MLRSLSGLLSFLLVGASPLLFPLGVLGAKPFPPALAQTVAGGPFEPAGNVSAAAVLPDAVLSGPYYQVAPMAKADGLDCDYTLSTDYGIFYAHGNGQLARRIVEVQALAALHRMSSTTEFGDALRSTGLEKIDDVKDVLRDPVGTVRSIPKGILRFGKRAREAFQGNDGDPHEGSRVDQALSVDKARRQIAAALGVDPETDNAVLREQLNRVAWVRAVAGLGLNIATAQLAPAQVAIGLTVTGVTGKLHDAALTQTPGEVREAALTTLQRLGVSRPTARKLMNNPAFTTLQLADIIDKLSALGKNPTLEVFANWMLSADSAADAALVDGTAGLVAEYARRSSPVRRFFRAGPMLAFEDGLGNLVVPAFRDYIIWTQANASLADRLRAQRLQSGGNAPVVLLVSGLVSPMTLRQADTRGVRVLWNLANQPSQLGALPPR